ncbi:hypothetical protein D9758_004847 [Tetrapyrgos nigripes]|uniref:Uncharacterized protein n=1 Tax=Tetrapyrgos nigripes TaxID=182062 RepID=A0A8H5G5R9_9AGAR|nr:hypothetical protein D9758_004847 [Tetrapyrgos nigripes]
MLTQSPQWLDMDFSSNHNQLFDSEDPSNASLSRWTTRLSQQSSASGRASPAHKSTKGYQGHSYYQSASHQSQAVCIIDDYSDEYICEVSDAIPLDDIPAAFSQWDAEIDNEYLRACYRMKGSLVLDSTTPQSVPHILITPCAYWDDDCATWDNQIEPQCPTHLAVPEVQTSDFVPISQPAIPLSETPERIPLFPQPKTVFSFLKFTTTLIDRSSTDIMTSAHRRQYKSVVCLASTFALSYRTRYDTEYLFAQIEKPFCWVDPAEALLAASNHHPHTIIIDSPHPFTIPHIIITAPPPEDLWASFTNTVPSPQNAGFGYYLTVPGHKPINPSARDREFYYYTEYEENCFIDGSFHDASDSDSEDGYEEEEEESYGSEFLSTLDSYNLFDAELPETPDVDTDSADSSDSDSPPPETPDDGYDFEDFFGQEIDRRAAAQQSSFFGDDCPSSASSMFSNWDDEDEDDLPPIDDEFYQSVLRRQDTD